MTDIAKKLIAVLRDDATMKSLMGATAADTRVYAYYEPDAFVTTAEELAAGVEGEEPMPAYITTALINRTNPGTGAVVSPVFSFAIWARDWSVVDALDDRLTALLHKQILTTADSRRIYSKIVNVNDSAQVQPNFRGRTFHIRAGYFENP